MQTQEHYGEVKASQQAGAVTYFGFLSIFPILALAFFFVGYLSRVFPDAQDTLVEAISSMLPGIIGDGEGELSLTEIEDAANTVGIIGLVGVLYTGLGWLSALRDALITVFELPEREQPNFVMGKVRDLITLAVLGAVLLIAVAATGVVAGFSEDLLDWANLSEASHLDGQAGDDRRRAGRQLDPRAAHVPAARGAGPAVAGDGLGCPAGCGRLRDPQAALDAASSR